MNRRIHILAAAAITATALGAYAVQAQAPAQPAAAAEVRSGDYVLDASHGKVTWSIDHLGFSTYVGQFTGVDARLKLDGSNPAASVLQASVKADSVGTLNKALDDHLKSPDFLDAAKFPTASFRSTGVRLTGPRTADIAGELTLHGVTKPVTIQATFNKAGVNPVDQKYSVGFDGRAVIRRSDFGIETYLPVLGDEVTLNIEAEFKPAA
jgi:polyisoprenoid-binding protein YceI